MTAVASPDLLDRTARRLSDGAALVLWVALATGLSLLMTSPLVESVLRGGFADPDDAMRLVQVRAWMAGQSWFDLTSLRLDPPIGASMHWSRLVDVPNALLIRIFSFFTDQAHAEALDRIVLPTLFLAGLYAGMGRLATVLLGRAAVPAAVLGTFLSGVTLVQFQPGRIGHHAPETVALVFAVAFALESIDPARARRAALAGLLVAVAMAMSFETLPLLAALVAATILLWVVRGAPLAPMLGWFAAGLGLVLPFLFVVTVPPRLWFAPVCDAFAMPHLGAGLIFAGGALGLSLGSRRLRSPSLRLAGATGLGAAVLAFVGLFYPDCLHSPFAGVDPLVRTFWLDNVVESKPLLAFMQKLPMTGLAIVSPALLGLICIGMAALTTRGIEFDRFAVLAVLTATGVACGLHQVRVFASVGPLAICGGLFAVAVLRRRLAEHGLSIAATLAPVAVLPFTSTAWALVLPPDAGPASRPIPSCLSPQALAALSTLPPGRIVAPIDVGSHILVSTSHTVFAAPYHRNNDGNRFALDVFLAPPSQAKALLAQRQVAYVVTCAGMGATDRLAKASDSLAASLKPDHVPDFLVPVPLIETPYRAYALKPSS